MGGIAVVWAVLMDLLEFVMESGCAILHCGKKRCQFGLQKDIEGGNEIFVLEGF